MKELNGFGKLSIIKASDYNITNNINFILLHMMLKFYKTLAFVEEVLSSLFVLKQINC